MYKKKFSHSLYQAKKKAQAYKSLAADKRWLTISNLLTLARLFLAPVIMLCLYNEAWWWSFGLFCFAGFTDVLDGYAARLFGEETHLGELLDPIADKALVLGTFGAFAFFHVPFFHVPAWFWVCLLMREVIMIAGAGCVLLFYDAVPLKPTVWGKLTTFFQLLFIAWVYVCYFADWQPTKTYWP